ncbi:MAG: hypothetical protein ACOC9Z_08295 [Chloroflexota bacterium]
MLAKLINLEDDTIVCTDAFPDEAALAAANERAQEETDGRLSWKALGPREQGEAFGWMLAVMGGLTDE